MECGNSFWDGLGQLDGFEWAKDIVSDQDLTLLPPKKHYQAMLWHIQSTGSLRPKKGANPKPIQSFSVGGVRHLFLLPALLEYVRNLFDSAPMRYFVNVFSYGATPAQVYLHALSNDIFDGIVLNELLEQDPAGHAHLLALLKSPDNEFAKEYLFCKGSKFDDMVVAWNDKVRRIVQSTLGLAEGKGQHGGLWELRSDARLKLVPVTENSTIIEPEFSYQVPRYSLMSSDQEEEDFEARKRHKSVE